MRDEIDEQIAVLLEEMSTVADSKLGDYDDFSEPLDEDE